MSFRNKRLNTRLGTSKEEQKNNKMRTITGTLSQLWNKQNELGV